RPRTLSAVHPREGTDMTTLADRPVELTARPIPIAALKAQRRRTGPAAVVRAYVALTKPRIIELLLVTTVPAMFLARQRLSPLWLTLVVLVGGAFAAGAA